ncbi:A/G-specific adenine glycosylase [Microaerobacter geothermalis]|uniref:A/G-specific adenine glycosylase n=1 Tax=Microaerobacter geothermalis TaxID=674972 RepID=UPI001F1F0FC7|nr:A/G-specific adenine glycosylase [Microaerobacter geothermalis]MCF6094389.1 A/G-specific adenine glycosylase [Microaerobacter geothermalis]
MEKQRVSEILEHFPVEEFQEKLLKWFERDQRDLPWRKDRDPYKIWVSEIMLQQTRVDTVIPYYLRFLNRFPTLNDLAEASQDEVLKEWEGLGYYSRVRHLHEAVKEVKERYGGQVPDSEEEIRKLKGIGSYTAGAILSIAYGKPVPAVDGNVMRVLSRILYIKDDVQTMKTKKLFEDLARKIISPSNPSFFNQAMMELGALICTPKSPSCLSCPVVSLCRGREKGEHGRLPIKGKKKPPVPVTLICGVIVKGEEVLIDKRENDGLLKGLWEFPQIECNEPANEIFQFTKYIWKTFGVKARPEKYLMTVTHTFSHVKWHIEVYQYVCEELDKREGRGKWVSIHQLNQYPFSVSHGKICKKLQ